MVSILFSSESVYRRKDYAAEKIARAIEKSKLYAKSRSSRKISLASASRAQKPLLSGLSFQLVVC
jgi:hypothetical protein